MARTRTPKSVTEAAERANELHKEVYGLPATEESTEEAPVEVEAAAENVEEAPEQQEIAEQPVEQPLEEAPAPEEPAETAKTREREDWKARYLTLKGKYDAEVPRLSEELRMMRDEIREIRSTAQRQAEKPREEPAPTPMSVSDMGITQEEIDDYGEDLISLIRRVTDATVKQQVSVLKPRIDEFEGQLQQTRQLTTRERVFAKLDDAVQDWREINQSPEFLEWLTKPDPFSGDSRRNLLMKAFNEGDASRVARFFEVFLEGQGVQEAPATAAKPQPAPAPRPKQVIQGNDSLARLAGPGRAHAGAQASTTPESQAPVWTRAQIAKFSEDKRKGLYKNNPERKAELERSLAQAMAAHTIVT